MEIGRSELCIPVMVVVTMGTLVWRASYMRYLQTNAFLLTQMYDKDLIDDEPRLPSSPKRLISTFLVHSKSTYWRSIWGRRYYDIWWVVPATYSIIVGRPAIFFSLWRHVIFSSRCIYAQHSSCCSTGANLYVFAKWMMYGRWMDMTMIYIYIYKFLCLYTLCVLLLWF